MAKSSSQSSTSEEKKQWIPTEKRFVCFLDIMGFKDMVMRNSHETIYEQLSELSKLRDSLDNYKSGTLKTVSFSDSIVIFTKDDSSECFANLTLAMKFLFSRAMRAGLPIKGAVSHGEMSVNSSRQIFFGQPLIDAYLLEEDIFYYGVVLHHTAEKLMTKIADDNETSESYFDCSTPLKSGMIKHFNLDWMSGLSLEKNEIKSSAISLMDRQRENTSGRPRKYIDNTIEIINKKYYTQSSGKPLG